MATSRRGITADDFSAKMAEIRQMQTENHRKALDDSERKKEAIRLRDIDRCKEINHRRLIENSNELRSLVTATNQIEAQQENLEYIKANERARINVRLKELQHGAAIRAKDDADREAMEGADSTGERAKQELKAGYDKQMEEMEKRKYLQYLALEEERKFVDKVAKDEQQKALESQQRKILEKKHWQKVINDFKDERQRNKEAHKKWLAEEEAKIAAFKDLKGDRDNYHKRILEEREKVAEGLRQKLADQMRAQDQKEKEREMIQEELLMAETEEAAQARDRLEKAKKAYEHSDMVSALKDSFEQKRQKSEDKKREWQEYLDLLKLQSEDAQRRQDRLDQFRAERNAEMKSDWAKAKVLRLQKTERDKEQQAQWQNKEAHDVQVYRDFVDAEREAFLRKKFPKIKDYVAGYERFPQHKDNRLFEKILKEDTGESPANCEIVKHPLAKEKPVEDTQYEVFKNMHHARVAEVYGIGSK